MTFIEIMSSPAGRGARVTTGMALIVIGLLVIEGTAGAVVAAVGLVPIAAGVFNFCLIGVLLPGGRSR